MAPNPMAMMKIAGRLKIFQDQHPRAVAFLHDISQSAIKEGSVIEVKVTDPDGKEYVGNIKVTPEDLETVEIFKSMKEN